MTSLSEISVVRVPVAADDAAGDSHAAAVRATWGPVEVPPSARPSPVVLTTLALLAGIGAMALAGLAVVSALRSGEETRAPAVAQEVEPEPVAAATPTAERRVLALLAKPSTERVVFRGSGGRLLLAVGSSGRAAVFDRGSGAAPRGQATPLWVVRSKRAVRAGVLAAGERATFLSVLVLPGTSVVLARDRASALRSSAGRIVATRG